MMPSWWKNWAYMSWRKQRNYFQMRPVDILKGAMELLFYAPKDIFEGATLTLF
jgi:hypothetical protein